jgi:hypothetical protein
LNGFLHAWIFGHFHPPLGISPRGVDQRLSGLQQSLPPAFGPAAVLEEGRAQAMILIISRPVYPQKDRSEMFRECWLFSTKEQESVMLCSIEKKRRLVKKYFPP